MTAEQFIKDYTNHSSNELADGGFHEWLTPEQALRAVEIAKDTFIEKANKWLSINMKMLMNVLDVEYDTHDIKDFIEDFKKYIED